MNSVDDPRADQASMLVTRSAIAATQWEIALSSEYLDSDLTAWRSRPVRSLDAWHESTRDTMNPALPRRLSPTQSRALWRRVIAESAYADSLLDPGSAVAWSYAAWLELNEHAVDTESLAGSASSEDLAALSAWSTQYRRILHEQSWTDGVLSLSERQQSLTRAPLTVALLDPGMLAPAIVQRIEFLSSIGWEFSRYALPRVGRQTVRLETPDPTRELEYALGWATSKVSGRTGGRVAVVIDDLDAHRGSIDRILARWSDVPHGVAAGRKLIGLPAIGAALNALALIGPDAALLNLSGWLRSSFFHGPDPAESGAAAGLEARLRSTPLGHVGFRVAFEHGGLRQRMSTDVPDCAARIGAALNRSADGPSKRSPTAWTRCWQDALDTLGWGQGVSGVPYDHARAWDDALASFASLTPIVGSIGARDALAQLRAMLSGRSLPATLPLRGVHVFERPDDVGPGYDAVWCTGFSADRWPRASAGNALLPGWLRRRHGLPWATPADTLARHRASTQRLVDAVPEVIFSWSGRDRESPTVPSALLDECATVSRADLGLESRISVPGFSPDPARFEHIVDSPPEAKGVLIEGGVSALDMQARCPLRAFIEYRLEAQPLEVFERGVSARLRGIMTHRAAELTFPAGTSQAEIAALSATELDERIATAAVKAVRAGLRAVHGMLRAFADFEAERLQGILRNLVALELQRAPFSVLQTEAATEIELEQYSLRARIDRLDEIGHGCLAVIDYKSGRQAGTRGWFVDPLEDTQIPVYAGSIAERLSAAALCLLQSDEVQYRGYWDRAAVFPGSVLRLPDDRTWRQQLDVWSEQVDALATAYMLGDGRIRADCTEPAEGAYAPLTRVYEALAAARRRALP